MNIWSIQQELAAIFDELEENGGELTEELEEQLKITQESLGAKVRDYTCVIKSLESDIDAIKLEQKRLKDLKDSKEKTIARLKTVIIEAIENFGDSTPKGSKFIDYGIGKVSIRRSNAVEINEDAVKAVGKSLADIMSWGKFENSLDMCGNVAAENLIDMISQEVTKSDGEYVQGYEVNEDELNHINLSLSVNFPVSEIINGNAYNTLKEVVKYTDEYNLESSISKSVITPELKRNGSCLPHIARLVENKNLTIK